MEETDRWQSPPPGRPELPHGEVHLWRVELPLAAGALAPLRATLSEEELARVPFFHREEDGARFVGVRGLLRTLLAGYLGTEPRGLRFAYGEHGKPELVGAEVRFNLSHAGEVALLAFAAGRGVGVDVERVREVPRVERIARRILAPESFRAWGALPPGERLQRFFEEWTALEALAKLRGDGVWRTLIRAAHAGDFAASRVRVDPLPGYVGTLAVEGAGARVRCWSWKGEDRYQR